MGNLEALKSLYAALGGAESEVAGCTTSVEVLNAIADKYGGDGDSATNSGAISDIASVAGDIGGGDFTTATVVVNSNGTYNGQLNVPYIVEGGVSSGNGILNVTKTAQSIGTLTVVLYKGTAKMKPITGDFAAVIVGDAEDNGTGVDIYGDCTLTLNASGN